MAIRPDYNIGTITLVSGSANFTTNGASMQNAAVEGGDEIITPSGDVLIISAITGQNSGTLFLPCPPSAAGADQPLRIRFQPDGSRYQGAIRDLMARWGQNGNVDAFAQLVGFQNGVPIFTSSGTMDVIDRSEFGPDDTHGNLQQLAELAKANDQFIIMGDDGVIALKPISAITSAIEDNAAAIEDNAAAIEDNAAAIVSLNSSKFNNPTGTVNQFIRGNGTLQSIVGTVAQSGGAIVERGSNANGEFVRFADGTQICWAKSSNSATTTNTSGVLFSFTVGNIAYPAEFYSPPQVAPSPTYVSGYTAWQTVQNINTQIAAGVAIWSVVNSSVSIPGIIAIGRWF